MRLGIMGNVSRTAGLPRLGVLLAFSVASGAMVAGCLGTARADRGVELRASSRPYEADIPLPAGFRLVDRSSEDWSNGKVRFLRHRYLGRADKASVREFYRKQMPLIRWSGVSDGQVSGRYTMRFRRGGESCSVVIEDARREWSREVTVDVTVSPAAP